MPINTKSPQHPKTLGAIVQDNETLTREWWTFPFRKVGHAFTLPLVLGGHEAGTLSLPSFGTYLVAARRDVDTKF